MIEEKSKAPSAKPAPGHPACWCPLIRSQLLCDFRVILHESPNPLERKLGLNLGRKLFVVVENGLNQIPRVPETNTEKLVARFGGNLAVKPPPRNEESLI